VKAKPRVDATTDAALTALTDALQAEEDKLEQDATARANRQALRAQGLLPGRGGPPIQTVARATVGSTAEERAAVVEALNALRDDLDHPWAARWGVRHGNAEGNLPGVRGTGGYTEYYVRPSSPLQNIRRLVKNTANGWVYYSPNHYGSVNDGARPFVKVTDA
jgi:hypothetical protein